ncbi:MAG: MarR family EPS-associated transcriptional regulator [Alphaproteobacteria bacterium PA3]|nr:MAG: MarR family EPS-associated transcriptional regulator [Alphaproteobacteria bacterium PA3]
MTLRAERAREDAKLRALRLIDGNPQISQRQLANELGISLGSAHYLLTSLIGAGMVRLGRFAASRKKQDYAYMLTPKGMAQRAELVADFLERKREEYEALKREIDALSLEVRASEQPHDGE